MGGVEPFVIAVDAHDRCLLGVAWIMVIGLAVNLVVIVATWSPLHLSASTVGWLAISGLGNAFGLLLLLRAMAFGKVGLVTSIGSTEGAIAAVYSVLAGEPLAKSAYFVLPLIVIGVLLVTLAPDHDPLPGSHRGLAAGLAIGAAVLAGASIYATGRASSSVSLGLAMLPPRLIGFVFIALPLVVSGRLRLTRPAAPLVSLSAVAEVAGWGSYAIGARNSIATAAVLASLFAAGATVGAFLLFRERLTRHQIAGILVIALGVALLSAIRSG